MSGIVCYENSKRMPVCNDDMLGRRFLGVPLILGSNAEDEPTG
jgi:hypothetical protein